ncbi:hypothetical protein ABPG75_011952 [Micractinium tetrahymenae]
MVGLVAAQREAQAADGEPQADSQNSSNGSSSSRDSGSAAPPPLGTLLLLQHPPVYTLGAGATEGHLRFDPAAPPLPLHRTERGGEVTYHGPGQLVLYPILDLRCLPLQPDLHWYLRSLEEVAIRALDAVSGLHGERIPGLTGVWVDGAKVAAIGVRASRWVSYHGLALNVVNDLTPFRQIVPCGISDRPVASVEGLLAGAAGTAGGAGKTGPAEEQAAARGVAAAADEWGEDPLAAGFAAGAAPDDGPAALPGAAAAAALTEMAQRAQQLAAQRAQQELLEEYRHALLDAFEEVFGVQLCPADAASDAMAQRLTQLAGSAEASPSAAAATAMP